MREEGGGHVDVAVVAHRETPAQISGSWIETEQAGGEQGDQL